MEFTSIHKPLNLSGFTEEGSDSNINYLSPSLEKSVLADAFGYHSSMSTSILGSEIKKGLAKVIDFAEKRAKEFQGEMKKALTASKMTPTQPFSQYQTKGLDAFIPDLPKGFSYKEVDAAIIEERSKNSNYSYDSCPLAMYNEAARNYISSCVEKIYANAMLKTIVDSQSYYLTVNQATQVGIGS